MKILLPTLKSDTEDYHILVDFWYCCWTTEISALRVLYNLSKSMAKSWAQEEVILHTECTKILGW